MSTSAKSFEDVLFRNLNAPQGNLSLGVGAPLGLGQRFFEFVKQAVEGIDLSAMTKDEFLAIVAKAYDTFIGPILVSQPFLAMAVKMAVMAMASRFYNNRSKPAALSSPTAE